jgi:hypothetical protein
MEEDMVEDQIVEEQMVEEQMVEEHWISMVFLPHLLRLVQSTLWPIESVPIFFLARFARGLSCGKIELAPR